MKSFSFLSLLLFLLAAGSASLAQAQVSASTQQRLMERYSKFQDFDKRCYGNLGAGADTPSGQAYVSACRESYVKTKKVADEYLKKEAAKTADIQKKTAQGISMCGGARTNEGQKACLESVAKNYEDAAKIKAELAGDLEKAYSETKELRDQNAKALKQYRRDQMLIDQAMRDAESKAASLRQMREFDEARAVEAKAKNASVVNAGGQTVAASEGGASSISGYKQKIEGLAAEQVNAQKNVDDFRKDASTTASSLRQQSSEYTKMAQDARAKASQLRPDSGNSGISKEDPGKGYKPMSREQALKDADAKGEGPLGGGSGASKTPDPGKQAGGAPTPDTPKNPTNTADGRQPPPSDQGPNPAPASSGGGSMAPSVAGGAAAPASGSSSSGASAGPEDPFAGMNAPATYNNGLGRAQGDESALRPLGQQGESPVAEGEGSGETALDGIKIENPGAVAGLSGESEADSASGASSAPGIRGADGKPLGFSAASGGGLQSERRNLDKDAAAKDQFSPNLASGAVSIAGSEMKSAIQSLAEEFGSSNIDLDFGNLSAEEKAALAPLEGRDGSKGFAPIRNGRNIAGSVQGSDASIQDEQSVALFSRARSAHERALLRGNLILGIRKKL